MAHQDEVDFLMEHIPGSDEERTTRQTRSRALGLVGFVLVAAFVVGKLSVFGSSEKSSVNSLLQLDDADLSQRKKALTTWVNEQLKETNVQVGDLDDEFTDGLKLMLLLEQVSGERFAKAERGKLRFHKVKNVKASLDFLKSKGAKVSGIDAEEVVDGNLKTTLDLVEAIKQLDFPKDAEDMQSENAPKDADDMQSDMQLDAPKDAEDIFTAWVNKQLKETNVQVEDLGDEFTDGLKLMLLLEQVSGERMPRAERGKLRFHKVKNVKASLDFLKSKGAKVSGIDAEEVVDGNLKTTLDLVWSIILRFAPKDAEDMQSESA